MAERVCVTRVKEASQVSGLAWDSAVKRPRVARRAVTGWMDAAGCGPHHSRPPPFVLCAAFADYASASASVEPIFVPFCFSCRLYRLQFILRDAYHLPRRRDCQEKTWNLCFTLCVFPVFGVSEVSL